MDENSAHVPRRPHGPTGNHLPVWSLRIALPDAGTPQSGDKVKAAAAAFPGSKGTRRARGGRSHSRRVARVALVRRNVRGFRARPEYVAQGAAGSPKCLREPTSVYRDTTESRIPHDRARRAEPATRGDP